MMLYTYGTHAHLVRVWDWLSRRKAAGQAKVTELDSSTACVHQDILGLQVTARVSLTYWLAVRRICSAALLFIQQLQPG